MKKTKLLFLLLLCLGSISAWGEETKVIYLPTTHTYLSSSNTTWPGEKMGTKGKYALPQADGVAAILGGKDAGLYDGLNNGQTTSVITGTQTTTSFDFNGRNGYAGSFAALVYIIENSADIADKIKVEFSTGTIPDATASFSLWKYSGGTASCLKSTTSTLTSNTDYTFESDAALNISSTDKIILVWNSSAAGSTNNIKDFKMTLTTESATTHNVRYNITDDFGNVVYTYTLSLAEGASFPTPTLPSTMTCSSDYYSMEAPSGTVTSDCTKEIKLVQNTPFKISQSFAEAIWHTITNNSARYYLNYVENATSMTLSATTTECADKDLFCFVGDVVNGFKIYNKAAGNGYLLSSSATLSGDGGSTYAIMTEEATATQQAYLWDVTKSSSISGANGFFLGQHNNNSGKNRLNRRGSSLAYWSTNADAGSTFIATELLYTIDALAVGDVVRLHNSARNSQEKSVSTNNSNMLVGNTYSQTEANQQWFVEAGSAEGTYRLRNLNDGRYIKTAGQSTQWSTTTDSPSDLYFHTFANKVSLTSNGNANDNSSGMHLDGSSNIVSWTASADASKWDMDVVSNSTTTYSIYDISVSGLTGEGGVTCKSGTTPVGNTTLSDGEAFFFTTANTPTIDSEHPVTNFFTAEPVTGYQAELTYDSENRSITATYSVATTTYTIHVEGCESGKAVYNELEYANEETITVTGVISDVTAKDIEGYKNLVNIDGSDIYVIYHVTTPVDGKAYMLYHQKYDGTLRYYNYTAGKSMSISPNHSDASTFVVNATGHNVSVVGAASSTYPSYYFRTEDGNFLTWIGKASAYKTDGTNVYGYSTSLSPTQDGYSDWTDMVIKPNSKVTDAIAIGGRREASTGDSRYSTIVVSTADGYNYANFADFYNGDNSNAFYLVEDTKQKVLKINIVATKNNGDPITTPDGINVTFKGVKCETAMPYFMYDGSFTASDIVASPIAGFTATVGACYDDEVTVTYTADAQTLDVTYKYQWNGNIVYTETHEDIVEGGNYPTPLKSADYVTLTNVPTESDKVSAEHAEWTITVANADEADPYPFTISPNTSDITWYYIKMRDSQYAYYDENGTNSKMTPAVSPVSKADKFRWAFVGSPFGYQIINKAAKNAEGEYLYMHHDTATDQNNTFQASSGTEYITVKADPNDGRNIYIKINDGGNNYINRNGGFYIWNSSAAKGEIGSSMTFELYDPAHELEALQGKTKIGATTEEGVTVIYPNELKPYTPSQVDAAIDAVDAINTATATVTEMEDAINDNAAAIDKYTSIINSYGALATVNYTLTAEYGTIMLPSNAAKEGTGLTIYSCAGVKSEDNTVLDLKEAGSFIKNTPYIIYGTPGSKYQFIGYDKSSECADGTKTVGLITGTLNGIPASDINSIDGKADGRVYILKKQNDKLGFYQLVPETNYTKLSIGANRCYITMPAETSVKAYYFSGDEVPTDIQGAIDGETAESTALYNLSGQQVGTEYKGIVIRNGKKYLNK